MKRLISLLLVLSLLLTGCSLSPSASSAVSSLPPAQNSLTGERPLLQRKDIAFSEMVFVRPDLEETIAAYRDFARRIKEEPDQVLQIWDEEAALCRSYYNMYTLSQLQFSLDTTSEQYTENYQYMQDFLTQLCPASMEFTRAILDHPQRAEIEKEVGAAVLQTMQTGSENYSEAQIELDLEENRLTTEYTQILSQDVVLETPEYDFTVSDLYYFLYQGSHREKQLASQLLEEYYAALGEDCGEIFSQLVQLRTEKARSAGFTDYLDYYYDSNDHRGYGRQEIEQFRQAVKTHLIPLYRQLKEEAETRLGRQLDLFSYTSPLPEQSQVRYKSSITSSEELAESALQILRKMSPETREMVDYMEEYELFDLISSPTKASGAFTTYFYGWQLPFVLSNYDDAGTYIHEFGHALNFFRAEPTRYMEQDLQGSDISEIHSQALELLAHPWLDEIYTDPAAAEKSNLFDLCFTVLSAVMVDEFQHILYENPQMTHPQRCESYRLLQLEYFGEVDYLGLSYLETGCDWIEIHHLFEAPMYYVEYAITAVAAMGFWQKAQSDWDSAFSDYIRFIDLPNHLNLPDSLSLAGLDDVFAEDTIRRLAEQLTAAFGKVS